MILLSGLLALLACAPQEPAAPAPTGSTPAAAPSDRLRSNTRANRYHVALRTDPSPPALSKLFVVEVKLSDPKTGLPVPDAQVHVDARMPAHGHGMSTDPIDELGAGCTEASSCLRPDGLYRTSGMKFHMPGSWTISVQVEGPAGADSVELPYEMPS